MNRLRLPARTSSALPYVALAALALAVPLLVRIPLAQTPDGLIHAHRTRALADALTQRVFLPRLFPDFAFGYGYPVLHYYAPLSYYAPAATHAAGLGLEPSVVLGTALFAALSAAAMFAFLRVWTASAIAVAVSALSLFAPYRLYNLAVRGALPEYAAFAWLPLIGLSLAKLLVPSPPHTTTGASPGRPDPRYAALLAVSCAGLILTHNLSAAMAALAGATLAAFYLVALLLRRNATAPRTLPLLIALLFAAAGAALAAFYALPAVMDLDWVALGLPSPGNAPLNHLATPGQLFDHAFAYAYPSAADPTVAAPLLFLAVNAALIALIFQPGQTRLRTPASLSLLLSVTSLFLISSLSAPVWTLASPVLSKLQFPWRWHTLLTFSSVWALALVLEWIRSLTPRRALPYLYAAITLLTVAFVAYAVVRLPRADQPVPRDALTTQAMWSFDDSVGQVGASWTGEFLPRWVTEQRWAIGHVPTDATPPDASLRSLDASVRPERAEHLGTTYRVTASDSFPLTFHTFYFPAWKVRIDGSPAPTRPVTNLALLSVDVPAGSHEVDVEWTATPSVRIGWAISAAAWLLVLGFLFASRSRHTALIACWSALGILVVTLWMLPPRATQPGPVGADYGSVRLEAASLQSAQPEDAAQVDLTWFIAGPDEPLTAFIHIVDANNAIVAQDDGALAGPFTPFERWLPGMVLTRRHHVPLPVDLPPGPYTVLAGVYPSANPDAALIPKLDTDPSGQTVPLDANGRIAVTEFIVAPR